MPHCHMQKADKACTIAVLLSKIGHSELHLSNLEEMYKMLEARFDAKPNHFLLCKV